MGIRRRYGMSSSIVQEERELKHGPVTTHAPTTARSRSGSTNALRTLLPERLPRRHGALAARIVD